MTTPAPRSIASVLSCLIVLASAGEAAIAATLDFAAPPGGNDDKAEFPATNEGGAMPLLSLVEKDGFLGDLKARTFQPVGETKAPNYPTAWLPTARVARAWQSVTNGTPFEKE